MYLPYFLSPWISFQITNEVQHDSSLYHHQTYQSIPDYLLEAFCSHWNFCALPCLMHDFDFHHNSSSLSSDIVCLNLFQRSPQLHCILQCTPQNPDDILLVYDPGVSAGLTPFKSDFFDYVKCSIPVHDVLKDNKVIGIRTTIYKFVDTKGQTLYLQQVAYHLPSSDIELFSPQVFH